MKNERDFAREIVDAKWRLKRWAADKHKYPNNTAWWREFYLSSAHAETTEEAQELIRKAADQNAAEELEAMILAEERAERWKAINKSKEARGSRRADGLRILSLNLGHVGVVFLLLYFAFRLTGRAGLPILDTLWALSVVGTPLCYVMAVVFTFKAASLWEKAQRHGRTW